MFVFFAPVFALLSRSIEYICQFVTLIAYQHFSVSIFIAFVVLSPCIYKLTLDFLCHCVATCIPRLPVALLSNNTVILLNSMHKTCLKRTLKKKTKLAFCVVSWVRCGT